MAASNQPHSLSQDDLITHYSELCRAIRTNNFPIIQTRAQQLGLQPDLIQKLIDDAGFRRATHDQLENVLSRWYAERRGDGALTQPDLPETSSHLLCLDLFFNKEAFMDRMLLGEHNLQDLAVLAAPGGIRYLCQALDLRPTDDREVFYRRYNQKYYTRQCARYIEHKSIRAEKVGQYNDVEMIEAHYMDSLDRVLLGAVIGRHLDLIKTYAPKYLELEEDEDERIGGMDLAIHEAIGHESREIYDYLVSIYPADIQREYEALADTSVDVGSLEHFRFFRDQLPQTEYQRVRHEKWTERAVRRRHLHMIDELKATRAFDPDAAAMAACECGHLDILRENIHDLFDGSYSPYMVRHYGGYGNYFYIYAKNVEVCQVLYDEGQRPDSANIFDQLLGYEGSLSKLKFFLDHFDIATLRPTGILLGNALGCLLRSAYQSQDLKAIEMILDHPGVIKYGPWPVMWKIITYTKYSVYEATALAELSPVVAQMLVDRGFVIDVEKELAPGNELSPQLRDFVMKLQ